MAFADVMQKIGRFIGLYSDSEPVYDEQGYAPQPEAETYEEEAPAQEYRAYGSGNPYVVTGAKPQTRKGNEPSLGLFGRTRQASQPRQDYAPDNVIPMPERDREQDIEPPLAGGGRSSNIIFCVRRKDDSSQIIQYLMSGVNVILNFEELDDAQCQRVLDMVSGAAFALRGTVERISHRNYLVAPTGVKVIRSETENLNVRHDGTYGRSR